MPHVRLHHLLLLSTIALLLSWASTAAAQDEIPPLPMDPEALTGTLDNGFTYIIRRSTTEPGRADITFAVKVGSSIEKADEAGFSNLLSYMAFKGTRHRSQEELVSFFSARGLKIGDRIELSVTHDETLYSIRDFPVGQQSDLSDLLWIIKGWTHEMSLDSKDMEDVSQQIINDMDTSDCAESRIRSTILERALPIGHPYGVHTPVGNPKVLRAFPYQNLRDFYARWYRPDLQGIIVVGDISPREVERRIKSVFGNIAKPSEPLERVYPEIPEHHKPQAIVVTDRGIQNTTITVSWAHTAAAPEVKASAAGLLMDYNTQMITMMMERRLQDVASREEAPFIDASFKYTPFLDIAMTEDAFTLTVTAPGAKYQKALESAVDVIRETRDSGFTEAEYQEASKKLLDQVESFMDTDQHMPNSAMAERYTIYFTRGGYAPGVELQRQLLTTISEQVTLDAVNNNFRQLVGSDQSLTITVAMPRKPGVVAPSGNTVLRLFDHTFN